MLLCVYALEITTTAEPFRYMERALPHILAGFTYWERGDYGINPEHPPLAKLVGAIPLLFMHLDMPHLARDASKPIANLAGSRFVYGNNAETILLRTRLAEAVLGLFLILLVFEFGKHLFGQEVALIAVLLTVFEPNLLAHSALVTTDAAFSLFYLAAVYAFWRLAEHPSLTRLVGCGFMAGLALASKHSALILLPTLALLAAIELFGASRTETRTADAPLRASHMESRLGLVALSSSIS